VLGRTTVFDLFDSLAGISNPHLCFHAFLADFTFSSPLAGQLSIPSSKEHTDFRAEPTTPQ